MVSSRWNICRQPPGERKGNNPSRTSTRASAAHSALQSKAYFFAGAAPTLPEPRKALKNSEPDGSTTSTSDFLLKLAL